MDNTLAQILQRLFECIQESAMLRAKVEELSKELAKLKGQ